MGNTRLKCSCLSAHIPTHAASFGLGGLRFLIFDPMILCFDLVYSKAHPHIIIYSAYWKREGAAEKQNMGMF